MSNLISFIGRVAYQDVFHPRSFKAKPGEKQKEPEYQIVLMIPKDRAKDDANFVKLAKAIRSAGEGRFGGKLPNSFFNPIKDGDKNDNELYAGMYYMRARSRFKPRVVYKDGADVLHDITQSSGEFYRGCYAQISIKSEIYTYDHPKGSKGATLDMVNVLKVDDGDRINDGPDPADDFGGTIATPEAADDPLLGGGSAPEDFVVTAKPPF